MNKKLNIGCGEDILKDYTNLDIRDLSGVDVVADARKLPFEDGVFDELFASQVIEHFPYGEVEAVFSEWVRVLKSGGKIIVECPDIEAVIRLYLKEDFDFTELRRILYCDQDHEHNYHNACFNEVFLRDLFEKNNLEFVKREKLYKRYIRMSGVKK